jgi:hypothetical protein
MLPKVQLLVETKGEDQEENDIENNIKMPNICVGTRHKETH